MTTVADVAISATPEWGALAAHRDRTAGTHLRELFAADPRRAEAMTITAADLTLDYSKHRIIRKTLPLHLGKAVAVQLGPALTDTDPDLSALDGSTASLVARYRAPR